MRRSHRKSRYGCKECKKRHAKCDETRPVCLNCKNAHRRCSFLDSAAVLPPSPSPPLSAHAASGSPALSNSPAPRESATSGPQPASSNNPEPGLLGERYSLLHLELLHHFEHHLGKAMAFGQPSVDQVLQAMVKEAFTAPFLMDELLALSAAHRSTLAEGQRDFYLAEATRLQTRSLTQYNSAQADLSEKNCLVIFLFSAFLGQHLLFETFSLQGDLAALLDKFVQCLGIHRGIAAVAGRSWPDLQAKLQALFGPHVHSGYLRPELTSAGTECAGLLALLDRSELRQSSVQTCRDAVEALQSLFDLQQATESPQSRHIAIVQEWPVRVPQNYINLLAQRRPEALVILAYYSVLLHRAQDYWFVGGAGSFLIRSISDHLGPYWANWLEWPNRMLEAPAT